MKRRFPILLKVAILGIGVSILTAGTALTVSYLNQRQRSEHALINNIDSSLDAAEYLFTDSPDATIYTASLKTSKNYIKTIYDADPEKRTEESFTSFEEFANYYAQLYPWIYPKDPHFGLISKEEADFKIAYYSILNLLQTYQLSSACRSAFLAYTDDQNRLVMMGDSRMEGTDHQRPSTFFHVPGSYYQIKDSDYFDDNQGTHFGYILAGYRTRFIQINDSTGGSLEPIATLFIEYDLAGVETESRDIFLKELLVLGLSSLALIGIYVAFSYLLFVRNINKLSTVSGQIRERLNEKNMNEVIDIPVRSNDEMKDLSESFTDMQKAIINYVNIIHEETIDKERTNAELMVASKIQLDSLPAGVFEDKNASLRASIKTAKEVGGDFYDYFYLDDHRLAVLIADVSGKGIPASLFMMKGKELLKSAVQSYKTLVEAINGVNNILTKNNKELLFITSFIGVIDFSKNEIRYINAGQEKPYIVSNNKVYKLEGESNIVLGVEEGYNFKEETHKFNKGDYLFMFTDGLNESINSSEEEFGYQRVEEALENTSDLSLDEVINKINSRFDAFTDCKEQFDDITLLITKFKDNELKLHYEKKDYEIISEIVDQFNDAYPFLKEETKASMGIIIDEIVNNLISYEKREDLVIDIEFSLLKDDLKMRIISNGDDYDPFENHKEKYLEKFHSEIEEGGFGLSIIKDLSKSYSYKYKNGHSIIEIIVK